MNLFFQVFEIRFTFLILNDLGVAHVVERDKGFTKVEPPPFQSGHTRDPCDESTGMRLAKKSNVVTLPETIIAPENGWLEY